MVVGLILLTDWKTTMYNGEGTGRLLRFFWMQISFSTALFNSKEINCDSQKKWDNVNQLEVRFLRW